MRGVSSTSPHALSQSVAKTWDSIVNWTRGKLSHIFSRVTFNSETVVVFGLSFKKVSCIARQTRYLQEIQISIWRTGWPLFLLNQMPVVCVQALATCAVCADPHLFLNLSLRLTAVSCSLQWNFKQKLINNFNYNYCLQKNTTEVMSQWRHCHVKLVIIFVETNEN